MKRRRSRSLRRRYGHAQYKLPIGLEFVPGTGGKGKGAEMRPGRGSAGWTVVSFSSRENAIAWMRRHPNARMPAWARIERGEV